MEEIAPVEETALVEAPIALEAAIFHAAGEEIETHSVEDPVVPEVMTARVPGLAAAVAPPVWDPGAADLEAGAAVVAGAADSSATSDSAKFRGR